MQVMTCPGQRRVMNYVRTGFQDAHGLIIFDYHNHNNLFLGYGGDNWEQEEFIKPLLLRRLHSELPWYHLL